MSHVIELSRALPRFRDEQMTRDDVTRELRPVQRMALCTSLADWRRLRDGIQHGRKPSVDAGVDKTSLDRIGWAFGIVTLVVWAIAIALVRIAAL